MGQSQGWASVGPYFGPGRYLEVRPKGCWCSDTSASGDDDVGRVTSGVPRWMKVKLR